MAAGTHNGASDAANAEEALAKDDAVVAAAAGLSAEVHAFEALTARLGRLELSSEEKMTKAGEVLVQAAQSHQRFVERLSALISGIEDARSRQNESAARLSRLEEALTDRWGEHDALRGRFADLGAAAREIRDLLGADEGVSAARERLTAVITTAKQLAEAAQSAQLVDLARDGHTMLQQLEALSRKLARVP